MAHKRASDKQANFLQNSKREWLNGCRQEARRLLRFRPFVTAEDVTERVPRPGWLHPSNAGAIFTTGEFQFVGYTTARRLKARGHALKKWSLKNPTEPPQRLHVRGEYDSGD